jgi:hypothetical protein
MNDKKPVGTLLIVAVLAFVILVSWFGIYALYLARS